LLKYECADKYKGEKISVPSITKMRKFEQIETLNMENYIYNFFLVFVKKYLFVSLGF
jgi:hypothetical protein